MTRSSIDESRVDAHEVARKRLARKEVLPKFGIGEGGM